MRRHIIILSPKSNRTPLQFSAASFFVNYLTANNGVRYSIIENE